MKSFNNRTVKFERYGDEELELFASLTCNGCGQTVENDEGLKKKLDRLAKEPVDVVHFSSCTNKKDKDNPELKKRCPWVEKMKDYLESRGVEVVYGTHH
jgi:predicted metal-binding protein